MLKNSLMAAALALAAAALVSSPAVAGSCSDSKSKSAKAGDASTVDIFETARAAGSFSTLLAAVEAAGLAGTLKGDGPFTVFAPTDAAFAKLPPGTVEALLADKAKLTAILTYHVVAGKVLSSDLATVSAARTVQGQSIQLALEPTPRVNDANIVMVDIAASNGVIHVIDTVILPPVVDQRAGF